MKKCNFCGLPIKISKKSSSKYCRSRCKQSAYYRRKMISGIEENIKTSICPQCNHANKVDEYILNLSSLGLKGFNCDSCKQLVYVST